MPRPEELPDSLKKLSRRQGVDISHAQFDSDVRKLTRVLSLLEEELRQRAEVERAAREEREKREVAANAENAESGDWPTPKLRCEVERTPGERSG